VTRELRVDAVEAFSRDFAQLHGLPVPLAGSHCLLNDARSSGAFGSVHQVARVDGIVPSRAVLAKIYDDSVLAGVGGRTEIANRQRQLLAALDGHPGWVDILLAVPFCLVEGDLDGSPVLAAFMLDLAPMGFGESPFDRDTANQYRRRPPHERIDLAFRLAKQCALLEQVGFVHGDLNPENVLADLAALDVQLIDFDTGAVIRRGDERPLCPGKADACLPPEVKGSGNVGPLVDVSRYTPAAERWAVGSLVVSFILGIHPAFFLRAISRTVLDAYANGPFSWPEIDADGPLFTRLVPNRLAYGAMRADLLALPAAALELVRRLFAAGTDGELRPSAADWVAGLGSLREPPHVDRVLAEPLVILAGDAVTFSWATTNASHVMIRGVGRCPAVGSLQRVVSDTTTFEVQALGPYGAHSVVGPRVFVIHLPDLEAIRLVPSPPLLSLPEPKPPPELRLPGLRWPAPGVPPGWPGHMSLGMNVGSSARRRRSRVRDEPSRCPFSG